MKDEMIEMSLELHVTNRYNSHNDDHIAHEYKLELTRGM